MIEDELRWSLHFSEKQVEFWRDEAHGPSDPVLCPKLAIDSFLACYRDRLEVIDRGIQVWVRKR